MIPDFPGFKSFELSDRDLIHEAFWSYQPEVSELNFTNLFIWREHYRPKWCFYEESLIVVAEPEHVEPFAFAPVGPEPRTEAVLMLFNWLRETKGLSKPRIERADKQFVEELKESPLVKIEPQREHFDYVYLREALATLSGNKYHSKKNHINAFRKSYEFEYQPLTPKHIPACIEMAEAWCTLRRCEDDMSLTEEWEAVREALNNYEDLKLFGGVIIINGKVEAFSIGERLNNDTVVVHIEKANPQIRGLYTAINQQCSEHAWDNVRFVNREQDLGTEGLRQAKLSYHPDHLVEKFRIRFI